MLFPFTAKNPVSKDPAWGCPLSGLNGLSPRAAVCWSHGVMKKTIQVEIRAFAFANTPILQYSSTPRKLAIFTDKARQRRPDPKDQVFDVE
jgi:hypothetical protein